MRLEQQAGDRHLAELFFDDEREAGGQGGFEHDAIEITGVIGDDHARPAGQQVLVHHAQAQTGDREKELDPRSEQYADVS